MDATRSTLPRIAVHAGTSIGGTEKAATIYAVELARRGYAVDYLSAGGPRSGFLEENGVRLMDVAHDFDSFLEYLREARPSVIHHHVPGYPIGGCFYEVLQSLGDERPKVIETNVFGRLEDPASEPFVDFRCFVSAASAAQALFRARRSVTEQFFERQTVLYYPVIPPAPVAPEVVRQLRTELEVRDSDVLAVRIGRAGHKWARWECEAFQPARRVTPYLRLLLMEPPESIWMDVAAGRYGRGIILRKETRDFGWLAGLYAAADLTLHASDWGESFGYTVGEAMAAGHPVITRTTPWGDNAQVELVENGVTGYVCRSVPEMSRRLAELASDAERRRRMGAASRERIARLASVSPEIDLLEEIIDFCLTGRTGERIKTRAEEAFAFAKAFRQRERATSEAGWWWTPDTARGNLYGLYRGARSGTRALLNRWKRR